MQVCAGWSPVTEGPLNARGRIKPCRRGSKDKLPPGAAEAEFAFYMAQQMRAGIGLVSAPLESKRTRKAVTHPSAGAAELEHEGQVYYDRNNASVSVGIGLNHLPYLAPSEKWGRLLFWRKGMAGSRAYYLKDD